MIIKAMVIDTKSEAYKYIKNVTDIVIISVILKDEEIDFTIKQFKELSAIEEFDIIKNTETLLNKYSDKIIKISHIKNRALVVYVKDFDDKYLFEIVKKQGGDL